LKKEKNEKKDKNKLNENDENDGDDGDDSEKKMEMEVEVGCRMLDKKSVRQLDKIDKALPTAKPAKPDKIDRKLRSLPLPAAQLDKIGRALDKVDYRKIVVADNKTMPTGPSHPSQSSKRPRGVGHMMPASQKSKSKVAEFMAKHHDVGPVGDNEC